MMNLTAIELMNFEKEICDLYNQGKIKSPVHLSGGNEKQLIKIFKNIKENEWIFTTYRSHYHALLKGMTKEELKQWIIENKSIHLMSKKYKIITSAIVGGTLSQGLGCALAIKLKKADNRVWCFCGDMTASLGVFWDCLRYAELNDLPITFIIEDNGLSTDTPTSESWGAKHNEHLAHLRGFKRVKYYQYERIYPHYGTEQTIVKNDGRRDIDLNKT